MANNPKTYTIAQIAVAARELREAAGAEEERYTGAEVVALLTSEVQILRQRGFSEERITELFTAYEIEVEPGQLERRSKAPGNLITRLIWGRLGASKMQEQNS